MPIGEEIKAAWSGPGKKWVIAGGLASLAYLWWTRARTGGGASGGDGVSFTPGGSAVADPITPPGGDYSGGSAEPGQRPGNNAEWLQEATAKLLLPPYNYGAAGVFNALTKALGGESLTTAETSIVERAITLSGVPPEGMPRINMASTANPQASTPAPSPPSSTVTHTVVRGEALSSIAAGWKVSTSAAYARNAVTIEAAAKAHGLASSRGGPNNTLGWWIYPGTVLVKP
ncbi:MAG: hypothetical protein ACM30G_04115 [Micromonosporaceae bacterium]